MNKTLKEKLKSLLLENGELEVYNLLRIKNWPQVDGEKLDLENYEIVGHDEHTVTVFGGGDWQDPQKVIIGIDPIDEELRVLSSVPSDYIEGIDEEDFVDLLEN